MKPRVLFNFLSATFIAMNLGLSATVDENKKNSKKFLDHESLEKNPLILLKQILDDTFSENISDQQKKYEVPFILSTSDQKAEVHSQKLNMIHLDNQAIYFTKVNPTPQEYSVIESSSAAATFFFTEFHKALSLMGKAEVLSIKDLEDKMHFVDDLTIHKDYTQEIYRLVPNAVSYSHKTTSTLENICYVKDPIGLWGFA